MKMSKERKENWKDGLLRCANCKDYKDQGLFGPDKRNRFRSLKSNHCKECSNLRSRKILKRYSENNNLSFYIGRLLAGVKDRSIKNGIDFNLDKSYLIELYNKQKGKCAVSGVEMTYITGKNRNDIYENISVDKIFPEKGYIKENIQLCCTIINVMKYDLSIEKLVKYCKNIILWQESK